MSQNNFANTIRQRLPNFGGLAVTNKSEDAGIAPVRMPLLDSKRLQLNLDKYALRTLMTLANVKELSSDSDSDNCGFVSEHTSDYASDDASDLESECASEWIQACSDQSDCPALEPSTSNHQHQAPFSEEPETYIFDNGKYQYGEYESQSEWVGDRVSTPPPDFADSQAANAEYTIYQQQQQQEKHQFSFWLAGASVCCYYLLHAIPFLRFVVIRLQRKAGHSNALLMTSIFSALVGFYITVNRKEAVSSFKRVCPTKETAAVYNALAASVMLTHVFPRFFMMLHFICNHIPLVGGVLVFSFMVVLIVCIFFAMLAAVGAYSVDVTVTLHGALKRWLGYGPAVENVGHGRVGKSSENQLPVKGRDVMDLPPSYVGF
ncbi:hypothetical protein HK100_005473 [Physocladia obscura]|uniref:Uncharacterized protein n=1 Tax=Physocladia obscura TaxID=109957 RepID=A0AAD5SXA8_9FUNG|nr:hypothetical protein HK100_005473 [Physocladia obscura]